MSIQISLEGIWDFRLDPEKQGLHSHYELQSFDDTITLPATVATAHKGVPHDRVNTGCLTDPYEMSGYSWYRRQIALPFESILELSGKHFELTLERTRISHIWVDGVYAGSFDSFIAPHRYDLTEFIKTLRPVITIMISNVDYKVPGGHMTSPDTQTNWNGILGGIFLTVREAVRLGTIESLCEFEERKILLQIPAHFNGEGPLTGRLHVLPVLLHLKDIYAGQDQNIPENASLQELIDEQVLPQESVCCPVTLRPGFNLYSLELDLSGSGMLWDEEDPYVYRLNVTLSASDAAFALNDGAGSTLDADSALSNGSGSISDTAVVYTGLRSFVTDDMFFSINGRKTFLRGKHDGMIFPKTGHAPMDVPGWLHVMKTAQNYGINHYRFHTCCPPEAAFVAADLLGIYLQPELPFWGTFHGPADEGYNAESQLFLETEGFRMLETFGNHPSYCMMSMGNELWGNASAINDLLAKYKAFRPQILFTQGSNNFFWSPDIQPCDDFFSGVRFSLSRQLRGSYAMCDSPQGHIQTAPPDTRFHYDDAIFPNACSGEDTVSEEKALSAQGDVDIQYGTEVRHVKLAKEQSGLIPYIPVISHEIGQYETFPDFTELDRYTGVLKPRNLQEFRRRLEKKGMLKQAPDFFKSSGALAMECYKSELEAALRSSHLAGFQLLDLQDFTGQGTALVGVLNSFMESKGLISPRDWRKFCSDGVLLAEFDSFVAVSGQDFSFTISLRYFRRESLPGCRLVCLLSPEKMHAETILASASLDIPPVTENGKHVLGDICLNIPAQNAPAALRLRIFLEGTDLENEYTLWCYPQREDPLPKHGKSLSSRSPFSPADDPDCAVAFCCADLPEAAQKSKACLLFLPAEENKASVEGTYCTDFWCYPMFRDISLGMHKDVPVGTMGLLIQKDHEAFNTFPTESFSTPQWYSIVTASRSTILDDTAIIPLVQTIDNFDRNHRLGLLYELYLEDLDLGVLVCSSDLPGLIEKGRPEAGALLDSLLAYLPSLAARRKECYALSSQDFSSLLSAEPESIQ